MTRPHGPDLVGKVRSSLDVVSLISEATPLKKAGRKYRGLCPFHNEKTPSFYVDENKQLFYCFGCGAGGDVFKFVMLRESVEFPEALRLLARRAGIPIPDGAGAPRRSEREAILGVCRAAAELYRSILVEEPEGAPGREYLKRRGVTEETRDGLGLGFAPDRWDTARLALEAKGFRPELLQAAGIVLRSESGGRFYDRFRSRIIFPIVNLSGDIIAFGGRVVGEGEPKYLNSPETLVYNKRETLFGLYQSRHAIKEAGAGIVVEGYLDWVSLYGAGVQNCVATLGTAFTDEQASLIRRFTDQVVLNYDADPAGQAASVRSLEGLLARGLSVRVLQLPEGLDPDAYIQASGPESYRRLLAGAPTSFDFLVETVTKGKDLSDPSVVAAAAREILPVIARIPGRIERSGFLGLLAERLGLEDDLMLAEMRDALAKGGARGASGNTAAEASRNRTPQGGVHLKALGEAEARLVQGLVESEACRSALLHGILPPDLDSTEIGAIVEAITSLDRTGESVTYGSLCESLREEDKQLLTRVAMRGSPPPDPEEARHCLESLRRVRLVRERGAIQKEMEGIDDPVRLEELLRRKIELSRRIDELS